MKKIVLIAIVALLAACGKQEAPAPAPMKEQLKCFIVHILNTENGTTLLEVDGDEPRNRLLREGNFGSRGDRFTFCE